MKINKLDTVSKLKTFFDFFVIDVNTSETLGCLLTLLSGLYLHMFDTRSNVRDNNFR